METRLHSFGDMRHDIKVKSLKREREDDEDRTWSSKISRPVSTTTDTRNDHPGVMLCQTKPFSSIWSSYPELERMATVLESDLSDKKHRRRSRVMEAEPQCAPATWERGATISVLRSRPSSDRRVQVWSNPELRSELELYRQEVEALYQICSILENLIRLRLETTPRKAVQMSFGLGLDTLVIEPSRYVTWRMQWALRDIKYFGQPCSNIYPVSRDQ